METPCLTLGEPGRPVLYDFLATSVSSEVVELTSLGIAEHLDNQRR